MKVNRDDVMEYHKKVIKSYEKIIDIINRESNTSNTEIFDLLGSGINPRDPQNSIMIQRGTNTNNQRPTINRISIIDHFERGTSKSRELGTKN